MTLATVISLASAVSATTITFGSGGTAGFDGVGDLGSLVSGPVGGGISLTVVATGCSVTPCIITSSSSGGGSAGFGYGLNDAGGAADGSGAPELAGPSELLTLQFSAPVTLTGFSLTDVDDGSNNGVIFSRSLPSFLSITNIQNLTDGANPAGSIYDSANSAYTSEPLSVTGQEFTVSASSGEFIRLRSVTFSTPEASTASLLGLGMLLLACFARFKRVSGSA